MKGWRTLALNGVLAVLPSAITYLSGVNWTDYVSPTVAVLIVTALNAGMRLVTNTPVGVK